MFVFVTVVFCLLGLVSTYLLPVTTGQPLIVFVACLVVNVVFLVAFKGVCSLVYCVL